MDYSSGEELWHFQWDAIQDPSRVWMKWNKEEEEGENHGPIDDMLVWIMWNSYDFVKRLSKEDFYELCNPNENAPFLEFLSSKGNLQDDEFSNNPHCYSKEQISRILQKKENILKNKGEVNDWKSNLDVLYDCSEEQLKSYYKFGKPLSASDILLLTPGAAFAVAKHLYRTMGTVLALSEPYESDVTKVFFNKNLPKNTVLLYDENTDLSQKLHSNYLFQSDFYFDKVIKYIYVNIRDRNELSNIAKNIDIPNFNNVSDIATYDYYGLFGGIQKITYELKFYKKEDNDKKIYVDLKILMEDWYGADEDDFIGNSNVKIWNLPSFEAPNLDFRRNHNQLCMNAFFLLQHKCGCSPFKTELVFHDYLEFKLY